jgi:hypothetical protein
VALRDVSRVSRKTCRELHRPYLDYGHRPKAVRKKLEELIGLGMMHKTVSPEGFRYHPHESLFGLFYSRVPAPEHYKSGELAADQHQEVWYSPDPQAPTQMKEAKEAEYGERCAREKERAETLMLAGKMVCPTCKGTRHKILSPDSGRGNGGFAKCLMEDAYFYFRLDGDRVTARNEFHCHYYYLLDGKHPDNGWATGIEELLERGWQVVERFLRGQQGLICSWCVSPERQERRRCQREVARVSDGQLHCPHCGGTSHRLASRVSTPGRIRREVVEYGAYLYSEVNGVCLNPRCLRHMRHSDGRRASYPNTFCLPDAHRWRACVCGKHAEIPENQTSTRCECGRTLWLNYQEKENA